MTAMNNDDSTPSPYGFARLKPIESAIPEQAPHHWQFCVNCGTKLDSRKCKLICHTCGFYHSCSEP